MPQVASDPKIYAYSQTLARPTRPPQQSDGAPSPFESLLDDSAQPTDQPAPTPAENKAAPADNSQAPAKANDCKPAVVSDNNAIKQPDADPLDMPDSNGKTVADSKTVVDVKLAEAAPPGDETKPPEDGKPADEQKTDSPAVNTSTDATIITTDKITAVVLPTAPVPNQGDEVKQLLPQQTPQTDAVLPLKPIDISLPKIAAGKQADSAKPADVEKQAGDDQAADETTDETQLSTKIAPQSHDGKPQLGLSDNDKQHIAQARGDIPAKGDLIAPDTPMSVPGDSNTAAPVVSGNAAQPPVPTATNNTAPVTPASMAMISPPAPPAAAIPLAGVPLEIASKALAGKNRFDIRLDPPELGRIEVRLDVDRDGNVTSRLTVDRAETLDLLRRDAAGLERALQDAGLKTSDNGLQFALRDQSMNQQQTSSGPDAAQLMVNDETLPSIDASLQTYGRLAGQGGGLDIRV